MKLSKNKIKASNAGGDILGSFFGLGFLLTFFGIVSGLGVLAYQIFFWLKNGEWKNIPMSML